MFVQLKKDFLGKPAGERIEIADPSGEGLIKQGIAEAVSPNEAINQLMAKAMEAASIKISESIAQTVDAALKQFQDAQSQARKHAVPLIFGTPGADATRLAGASRIDVYFPKRLWPQSCSPR